MIGFIGFGEASYNIICGLLSESKKQIVVYDSDISKATQQYVRIEDREFIEVKESVEEIVHKADYIFIAIPGSVDEDLFCKILQIDAKGKTYIDLCTALPETKKMIGEQVRAAENFYIDVAVMGSVPKLKHKVPMLISGDYTEGFTDFISQYNMDVEYVSPNAGDASIIKLCRSIYMKGLAALSIEMLEVSDFYGVREQVMCSLEKSLDADRFMEYTKRLVEGTLLHCERRKKEVENSLLLIERANLSGEMTKATISTYDNLIRKKES